MQYCFGGSVVLDSKVTKNCELVEARSRASYYRSADALYRQEMGVAVAETGSATVTMVARGSSAFFNRIIGLGVGCAATEMELDAIIDMLRGANASGAMFAACPRAQPAELPSWLEARGMKHGPAWSKLARDATPPLPAQTSLRIEEIDEKHVFAPSFSGILIPAFGMDPVYAPLVQGVVGKQGWRCYLAFAGEKPIATAGMYLEGDCAWLGFMATLPEARGRGAQSALIARRIKDGIEADCAFFTTETAQDLASAPNPSYRNMMRAGFTEIYVRPNYMLELQPGV